MEEERVKDGRLHTLKSEFDNLKMKDEESIDGYAGNLMGILGRYANLGGSPDDATLVKNMFDIMLDQYINVIIGIEQFYDLKKLAFDEAVGRLKTYEERTRQGGNSSRSDTRQVLLTQAEWETR